jgi:hypothetical protein
LSINLTETNNTNKPLKPTIKTKKQTLLKTPNNSSHNKPTKHINCHTAKHEKHNAQTIQVNFLCDTTLLKTQLAGEQIPPVPPNIKPGVGKN